MVQPPPAYNATMIAREEFAPGFCVIRVKPDAPLFEFRPGQFAVLGLLGSSPRCAFADPEEESAPEDRLIRRAYSIASSSRVREYVEFFLLLVRSGQLTPRLFALGAGDRLWLGPRATGVFTLDGVPEDRDILLVSTGTGLAPHMSMIRSLHRCNVGRRFAVVQGARYSWDLGYRAELEALDHGCGTLVYLPTITQANRDANWHGHVGRVQTILEDGSLVAKLGRAPDPARDHVFLCGNPEMVETLQAVFESRGFALRGPAAEGTLHVERF